MSEPTISPEYAAELGRQVDELEAENTVFRDSVLKLRDALRKIAYAPEGGVGPTLGESIQIAREVLFEVTGESE